MNEQPAAVYLDDQCQSLVLQASAVKAMWAGCYISAETSTLWYVKEPVNLRDANMSMRKPANAHLGAG